MSAAPKPTRPAVALTPSSEIVVASRSGAEAFRSFAVTVYGAEGVEAACIGLQDRRGLDVNLVLFGLWTAIAGGLPLETPQVLAALNATSRWQDEVVQPLRAVRRATKGGVEGIERRLSDPIREQVKAAELDAEFAEQEALAATSAELSGGLGPLAGQPLEARAARGAANLLAIFAALKMPPDRKDRADLAVLIRAVAPRLSRRIAAVLVGG